eukprot:UN07479
MFGIDFIESQIDTLNGEIVVKYHIYNQANQSNNIWEVLNVQIPTASTATVYIRRLDVFNEYIPLSDWTGKESGSVIYQNMKFVNGVDGILSGTNEGDDGLRFEI